MKTDIVKYVLGISIVCMSAFSLSAQAVEIPDVESRIRSGENTVPSIALPPQRPPLPANLPPPAENEGGTEEVVSAVAQNKPVPEEATPVTSIPEEAHPVSPFSGYLAFRSGYPGLLAGSLYLRREESVLPGFSVLFSHDSVDGFSGERPGNGFFDRSTAIDVTVFPRGGSWFLSAGLTENADGLQGTSPTLYSLTDRQVYWTSRAERALRSGPFTLLGFFDGDIVSHIPAGPAGQENTIAGYRLLPGVGLRWSYTDFEADLTGRFRYETQAGEGEFLFGRGDLSARYIHRDWSFTATASVVADSRSVVLVPFNLALSREGVSPRMFSFTLDGGLSAVPLSASLLVAEDPYIDRTGLSRTAADWNASLSASMQPADAYRLSADARFLKTAFNRTSVYAGETDPVSFRTDTVWLDRTLLETSLGLVCTGTDTELSFGWNSSWLDRVDGSSAQTISAGFLVFDRSPARRWESGTDIEWEAGQAEVPYWNLFAMVRPFAHFSLNLRIDDILSLWFNEPRMVNDVFTRHSGAISIGGRFDF